MSATGRHGATWRETPVTLGAKRAPSRRLRQGSSTGSCLDLASRAIRRVPDGLGQRPRIRLGRVIVDGCGLRRRVHMNIEHPVGPGELPLDRAHAGPAAPEVVDGILNPRLSSMAASWPRQMSPR